MAQHRDSYLADLRRQGFQLQDFQKVLLPRKVDVKTCPPITATAAVTWKGQPVICYFRKEKQAVVNGEVFSALATLNARYLASGDEKRFAVGSVEGAALLKLSRKSLVMALIRSAVIMLYAHQEAKVCLFKETSHKDSYSASFHVDYVYETNRTYTGSYRITVSIDDTGQIVATSP